MAEDNVKNITRKVEANRRKVKEIDRQACPHVKPLGAGSALVGMHLITGGEIFICQYCTKLWNKTEDVPVQLRPPNENIGHQHKGTAVAELTSAMFADDRKIKELRHFREQKLTEILNEIERAYQREAELAFLESHLIEIPVNQEKELNGNL